MVWPLPLSYFLSHTSPLPPIDHRYTQVSGIVGGVHTEMSVSLTDITVLKPPSPTPKGYPGHVCCSFLIVFRHIRRIHRHCAKTVSILFSSSLFYRILENTRVRRKPAKHRHHAVHQGLGAGRSRWQHVAEDAVPILPEPMLFRIRRHYTGRSVQTVQRRSVPSRRPLVQIQINVRFYTTGSFTVYFPFHNNGNKPIMP